MTRAQITPSKVDYRVVNGSDDFERETAMRHTRRFLLLASAATLLLSSCGGSSDSSDSPVTTDAPSAEQIQDLVDSGAADDIARATGLSEACIQLSLAISAAAGGMVPGVEVQDFDSETLGKSFDAIKGEAPANLREDIEVVKRGMSEYLAVLADYGNDFTAMMANPQAMERFSAIFDDESFAQASERFSAWIESVCSG